MRSDRSKRVSVAATFLALIALPATQLLTHIGADEVQQASAATTTTTTLPPLDHFECYELKPGFFPNTSATVQDQFGTMTDSIRFPRRLCNPTSKNGEGITDPTDHLVGYIVKAPKFTQVPNQSIKNQFGKTLVDVVRPDLLMVPTSKDGVPQLPPLDHFQCYKVKRSKGAPKFTKLTVGIANQFETLTVTVVKPIRLCAPANKNNEDPTAPTHREHLLCYKTKGTPPFGQSTHTISNQFGFADVTVIKRKELCVPSLKNYGSPSRAFLEKVPSLLD